MMGDGNGCWPHCATAPATSTASASSSAAPSTTAAREIAVLRPMAVPIAPVTENTWGLAPARSPARGRFDLGAFADPPQSALLQRRVSRDIRRLPPQCLSKQVHKL